MSGLATYGPFSAIYFLTYERFKTFCLGYTPELRCANVCITMQHVHLHHSAICATFCNMCNNSHVSRRHHNTLQHVQYTRHVTRMKEVYHICEHVKTSQQKPYPPTYSMTFTHTLSLLDTLFYTHSHTRWNMCIHARLHTNMHVYLGCLVWVGCRTEHFVAGGFMAGTVAAVATAPIDLIKTRIQVHIYTYVYIYMYYGLEVLQVLPQLPLASFRRVYRYIYIDVHI